VSPMRPTSGRCSARVSRRWPTAPTGQYALHDPAHNPHSHSIHNHFIVKSLALTAPGGYVAVLTSRYTMDAGNDRARREMAATADLVGAVRLPTGAFSRVAGTAVLTDLIVLRKRGENDPAQADQGWLGVAPVAATAEDGQSVEVEVNAYYATHPDNVLGALRTGHGMYNADTLMVQGPGGAELAEQLRDRLVGIRGDAVTAGLTLDARAVPNQQQLDAERSGTRRRGPHRGPGHDDDPGPLSPGLPTETDRGLGR